MLNEMYMVLVISFTYFKWIILNCINDYNKIGIIMLQKVPKNEIRSFF